MQYQRIRLSREGRLARATLCSPDTGNRVDARLLRELEDVAEVLSAENETNVLLLDAEGADFCLGWDDGLRRELMAHPAADVFGSIGGLGCVTVAALRGRAISAGLELALVCDIRIAAPDAIFAIPEVSEGLMPLAGATQRLPRVVGKAEALAMLLLGEEVNAARAVQSGLVSRVAEAGLEAEAAKMAAILASRGPLALRYAKEAAQRGMELPLEQGLRYEADLAVILQSTDDRAEGLRAFFEKRPPHFRGQ